MKWWPRWRRSGITAAYLGFDELAGVWNQIRLDSIGGVRTDLKCAMCGDHAEYVVNGNSLCVKHYERPQK